MDDLFITQHFDWDQPESPRVCWVNALLARLGRRERLRSPRSTGTMTSVEQRINLFHLLGQVLAFGVPGDVIEVGTLSGETAVLLQKVIDGHAAERRLHVYDAFLSSTPDQVLANFRALGLRPPEVHAGWFADTLPAQLPERIGFAHIDVHWPGARGDLGETIRHVLAALYPRLAPGAVGVVADYCDPAAYDRPGYHFPHGVPARNWWGLFPAIRQACDAFFADKPETVAMLYAGPYSHGYFRKR